MDVVGLVGWGGGKKGISPPSPKSPPTTSKQISKHARGLQGMQCAMRAACLSDLDVSN